jgi:hypothetical protein
MRDHRRRARVFQHEDQPGSRIGRVERHVRRARLQHAEDRDHQIERALHAHGHPTAAGDVAGSKVTGEPIRALVQLPIGERHPVARHGGCLRGARCLTLEDGGQCRLDGSVVRLVPAVGARPSRDELPLRLSQERQLGKAPRRIGEGALEQRFPVPEHPVDARGFEEIRCEVRARVEGRAHLADRQAQVERRRAGVDRDRGHLEPGQRRHGPLAVLQHEHHLDQRGMGQAPGRAQRLDQPLEGYVLVGEGAERHRTRAREQLAERRVTGAVAPHHERIDEEPDQILRGRAVRPAITEPTDTSSCPE